ncbi:hypothetical protein [Sphingobium chungbukense]|uniref:hypothetical protein n=1 Tax=Sphingobium chungbukense TaxID=56193 RepID=UPI00069B0D2A|nr:hypothetical protein [Sphingobium chungbukense]
MVAAAAIGAVATIGGTAAQVSAGKSAAKAQGKAAQQAADASERATQLQIEESRRQYDQTRADYAPYRETGYKALDTLAGFYGVGPSKGDPTAMLEATPGYRFQMDEGLKAIDRQNAARGALNSGGADKARIRYAQGLAASTYDTYANRLAALAGVGQSATGSTAAAGAQAAGTIAAAYGANGQTQAQTAMAAGNARASSYANTGKAIAGGLRSLSDLYFNMSGPKIGGSGSYGGDLGGIY